MDLRLNKPRPNSQISKLHSRHLLGRGYNEIIEKISENHERLKRKNLRIKSSKQPYGRKFSKFQLNKTDMNVYAAKKKLADEISQMIISNLKNNRDSTNISQEGKIATEMSQSEESKFQSSKILKQEIPNVEKFIVPFRRSK